MSDDEYRKVSKETTEISKTSSEISETRSTATGRYEKTTISEVFDKRINESESFEPSPTAPEAAAPPTVPGTPAPPAPSDRPDLNAAPRRMKLTLSGVMREGTTQEAGFDGDYILDCVARENELVRWEYSFPGRHRLYRATLVATPGPAGNIELEARFEGSVAGPKWLVVSGDFTGPCTLRWAAPVENPIAGCRWPQQVRVVPLNGALTQAPFYISPQPTAAEMARPGRSAIRRLRVKRPAVPQTAAVPIQSAISMAKSSCR